MSVAAQYGCEAIVADASAWAAQRDGLGADLVIDAAGVSSTLWAAAASRKARRSDHQGWMGSTTVGIFARSLGPEKRYAPGSFSHNWPIWERVIGLLADGVLDVGPIVGGIWPLDQWQEAFAKMHSGRVVKSILKPI